MESAIVSSRLLNSSKTLTKPSQAIPFHSHFSKAPLNQTLQTHFPSAANKNRRISHRCISIPRLGTLLQNPVPTALISRSQLASISSSSRAFASAGGGDGSIVETASSSPSDAIILDVQGMICGGCTASVKRILESQPQVSFAEVNLETATAVVSAIPEARVTHNWQHQLGETLANHLSNCGFKSNLRG